MTCSLNLTGTPTTHRVHLCSSYASVFQAAGLGLDNRVDHPQGKLIIRLSAAIDYLALNIRVGLVHFPSHVGISNGAVIMLSY